MRDPRREAGRPQGIRALGILAAGAPLLAILFCPLAARADEEQDFRAAVVMRCYYAVGEFGSELVDRCVKEDLEAAAALKTYPPESASLILSCTDRFIGDGPGRVKACVDQGVK